MWQAIAVWTTAEDFVSHVIPINDLREHLIDKDCWCHPEEDDDTDGQMYMHNSADGREKFESGERKPC